MIDYRLITPGLMISLTSLLCPNLKSSGANVALRPPGWVFGVVWPILYITTGLSWSKSTLDAEFLILTALLCSWLLVYSCRDDKIMGRNVIILSTLFSYYISYTLFGTKAFLLSVPLAIWLTFASYLNYSEVQNK